MTFLKRWGALTLLFLAIVSFRLGQDSVGFVFIFLALGVAAYTYFVGARINPKDQKIKSLTDEIESLSQEIEFRKQKLAIATPKIERAEALRDLLSAKGKEIEEVAEESKILHGEELVGAYLVIKKKHEEFEAIRSELETLICELEALHLGE